MTLKNIKAYPLHYTKLCASFQDHWWIQTGVAVRKRSIPVKINDFFVSRDLEIWWMTLKNNKASLLYYVKPCALFQSHEFNQIGVTVRKCSIPVKIGDYFVPYDLEIWWMSSKNNKASRLYYIKLCASFWSHQWTQTWLTVQNRRFFSCVTFKFDGRPWKTIGHLFYAASSLVHHFIAIMEFKLSYSPETPSLGQNLRLCCPLWPWNLTDDLEKQ